MSLNLAYCDYAVDKKPAKHMAPAEFLAALPRVAFPAYWFADYTGTNTRTVQRWLTGEQDIPAWVPRMLLLHKRLAEGLSWSEGGHGASVQEENWMNQTRGALWQKEIER